MPLALMLKCQVRSWSFTCNFGVGTTGLGTCHLIHTVLRGGGLIYFFCAFTAHTHCKNNMDGVICSSEPAWAEIDIAWLTKN